MPLTVPDHRELKTGLLRALIRDAGMSVEEFVLAPSSSSRFLEAPWDSWTFTNRPVVRHVQESGTWPVRQELREPVQREKAGKPNLR